MKNPFEGKGSGSNFDRSAYESSTFYGLLMKLPPSLISEELKKGMEDGELSDEVITEELQKIFENRESVLTESHVYDSSFSENVGDRKEAFFESLVALLSEKGNRIGSGTTAEVMKTEALNQETGNTISLAIKYLLTPNEGTLSAQMESAVLAEVERIKTVEEIENGENLKYISVPHPYFHFKNSKIRCYGMQQIMGFDLEGDFSYIENKASRKELIRKVAEIDIDQINKELETFFKKMHEYCLHGDVKPKNLMLDTDGKFYLIDFGQSRLATDMPDKPLEEIYNMQDDEVKNAKIAVKRIVDLAQSLIAER
jgi:uncharacterized protein (UPF0297 family)